MQCSMLYSLLKSVCCADSTLKQETGSTHLVIFLCDALISYSSTGPAVRTVQLYMSAIEVVCIAGLTIAVITNVMSKYEDLLIHATWNNQRTQLCKFDHPKYQMEKLIKNQIFLKVIKDQHSEPQSLAASRQRVSESSHLWTVSNNISSSQTYRKVHLEKQR